MDTGRRRDNRKPFTLLQIKMDKEDFLTSERLLKNSEDLTRLNPSWLTQFPEKQRQEIFFAQVLPVIALRTDKFLNDAVSRIPESHIETPLLTITVDPDCDKWLGGFTQLNFNLKEARRGYEKDHLSRTALLVEYVVLMRAALMSHKLWRFCAEFFLLGLAYSKPSPAKFEFIKTDGLAKNIREALKTRHWDFTNVVEN